MTGLDAKNNGHLCARMGRPRAAVTASRTFQDLWAPIDDARRQERLEPGKVAAACGFARASWFEYQNRGTIPFHLLERVVHHLGLRLKVSVDTRMSGVHATDPREHTEGTLDYGKKLAELFKDVPDDQQEAAFGAAYTAARTAIRELPFDQPAAGAKAHRGRSSKS